MATDYLCPKAYVGTTYKRALTRKNLVRDRTASCCPANPKAKNTNQSYADLLLKLREKEMRKPKDFDAQLKLLNEKAKQLKERKVRQLGELIVATGADTLSPEILAGALLAIVDSQDPQKREGWRKHGGSFFQKRDDQPLPQPQSDTQIAQNSPSSAQSGWNRAVQARSSAVGNE